MAKKQIAFLRGINISGKNKISMNDLKCCFEELGLLEVKTYLNSGNVVFSCDEEDVLYLSNLLEKTIKHAFKLDIPVFVIAQDELIEIIDHAPKWWGNNDKEIYDNLIFILSPLNFDDVYQVIGEPNEELEKIENYKQAIFWSFDRKKYTNTNWWSKTANSDVSQKLTIRTANTIKKLISV